MRKTELSRYWTFRRFGFYGLLMLTHTPEGGYCISARLAYAKKGRP